MKIRNLYPDESELIRNAQANDRRAQEVLYQKYAAKMLSVVRYYIRDIQHAEDIVMSGFFKAFTRLDQFGKTKNFEGWLRKIMVNESLNFLRNKNYLIFIEEEEQFKPNEIEIQVPQLDFSVDEIQLWIDQLPESQKIIFILFAIEGYTHQEIATSVKIPVGTSKVYLSRARINLQEKIKTHYLKKNEKVYSRS